MVELPVDAVLGESSDRGYPMHSPVDPVFPAHTSEPLEPVFVGVATPAIWSRVGGSLELALAEIWQQAGLGARLRPQQWVSLHLGRIQLNAHGWEALRARLRGVPPDSALVESGRVGALSWPAFAVRMVAAGRRRGLRKRVTVAEDFAEAAIVRATKGALGDLEIGALARGPFDARAWREVLIPWLAERLVASDPDTALLRVEHAVAVERRYYGEFGKRLVARGQLRDPAQVAYLTIDERLRAANRELCGADTGDPSAAKAWTDFADRRAAQVSDFLAVDVPSTFWGRPRVGSTETR